MKKDFRFLPVFFSLVLHGVMASFFIPFPQKISENKPVTVAMVWEETSQGSSQATRSISYPCHFFEAEDLGKTPPCLEQVIIPFKKEELVLPSRPLISSRIQKKMNNNYKNYSLSRGGVDTKRQVKGPSSNIFPPSPLFEGQDVRNEGPSQKKTYHPLPKYPWICRKRGQEGTVSLLIQTDGRGRVVRADLHKSSGYSSLDHAALSVVKEWIFSDFSCQKMISISFHLKG